MATGGQLFVIAIDGSQQSARAFEWYCQKLHRADHRVLLLNVANHEDEGDICYPQLHQDARKSRMEEAIKGGGRLLEPYKATMKEKNISGSVQTRASNKPGELIVEVAAEHKAIGVVIGTRGLGLIRRTIMGSVSDYVLHHAHCMVAVCKQQ